MKQRAALVLFLFFPALVFAQSNLPPEKLAALDGSYAAISQKSLTAVQAQLAQGKVDPKTVAEQMNFD